MKTKIITMLMLFISFFCFSQDSKISLMILGDETIAQVNIDTDKYLKDMKTVMDILEKEAKSYSDSQKIAVMATLHKQVGASFDLYAVPELSESQKTTLKTKLNAVNMGNTKYIDFPVLVGFNVGEGFSGMGIELPEEKKMKEYQAANLAQKVELNKQWAIENLSVLTAFEKNTDAKFEGVQKFGKEIAALNFSVKQEVSKLTGNNYNYWRAVMEMERGNLLIPTTKIMLLVSQGDMDYAYKFVEILSMFGGEKALSSKYIKEFYTRMDMLNEQLNTEIAKGIELHDKGKYKEAIVIYENVLKQYAKSAWTQYELYYSKNAMDRAEGKLKNDEREQWDKAKVNIYEANPLYNMDVRAGNAKEAYLMYRRYEVSTLFKDKSKRLKDIYEYADIALDLGVYDFAAQLFWLTAGADKENSEKSLFRYFYCLEKLNVKDLKSNFNYNFEKEFKKIEKEKEEKMKENTFYKSFKG